MRLLQPTSLAKLSFRSDWVKQRKTSIYEISGRLFLNMNFCFAYVDTFNFAHFTIEKSFRLIWVNYKMVDFTCNFHFEYLKGAPIKYGL